MPTSNAASLYKTPQSYHAMMAWYDAQLQKLTVPYETWFVETRFGPTHLIATGPEDAPPVVLLHGLNACAMMWQHQINALGSEYRLIVPDVIGMSGKSAPARPSTKDGSYAQWLTDVLDALEIDKAVFVGISNGGWLTLRLASYKPERIAGAFLMSSAGIAPFRRRFLLQAVQLMLLTPADQRPHHFVRMVTPPHLPVNDEEVGYFDLLINHFNHQRDASPLPDSALQKLTAPTVLLMGEHEVIFDSLAAVTRAKRLIPGLQSAEIVPGVGHGMSGDAPEVIAVRLRAFLETVGIKAAFTPPPNPPGKAPGLRLPEFREGEKNYG